MSEQINHYSLIVLMMIVLCFGVVPSNAEEAEMQIMEQKIQKIPAGALRANPSATPKNVVQPLELKPVQRHQIPKNIKKGLVITRNIPIISWFMDFDVDGVTGTGEFLFKFRFKWKDGDGDLCDGQWFLNYDHGNMSGNFRDLIGSNCRPKGFPKPVHLKTAGITGDEVVYLKGKELETVIVSFMVKDGAGHMSNKVVRKILLLK
jgi:hypothetical protein